MKDKQPKEDHGDGDKKKEGGRMAARERRKKEAEERRKTKGNFFVYKSQRKNFQLPSVKKNAKQMALIKMLVGMEVKNQSGQTTKSETIRVNVIQRKQG